MKTQQIARIFVTAILVSGITACDRSEPSPNASTTSPSSTSVSAPVSSSPAVTPSATALADPDRKDEPRNEERLKRREVRLKQFEEVLTPEQMQQLRAKLKQVDRLQPALASLNLSTEQKTKIQIIFEASYINTPGYEPDESE